MTRRFVFVLGAVVVLVAPATARAGDPSGAGLAEGLFEQARDEMKHGDYGAACPKLAESQRLDPSSGTTLNLVVCEEALGKVATAWVYARGLMDVLPDDDDRRPLLARKLAGLTKRLPRIVVRMPDTAPAGTRVAIDDVDVGASTLGVPLPVDPGSHRIECRAPGRADHTETLSMVEGQVVEWLALAGPPAAVGPSPSPPLHARWMAWAALGVGAAGLVAGGVLGALAVDRRATVLADCPAKQCRSATDLTAADQGQNLLIGTLAAVAVGAIGAGFGGYLLVRGGPGAEQETASPAVRGAVIEYSGAF